MKQTVYKVPGGKMLRIFLEEKEGIVEKIRITGDFFLHPEEDLTKLEEKLKGIGLNEEELLSSIAAFLKNYSTELYGFGPEDLTTAILQTHATN